MNEYEILLANTIKAGEPEYKIFSAIVSTFGVFYFSTSEKIQILKDIEDFKLRVAQGKELVTGFTRWNGWNKQPFKNAR